MSRPLLLDLFCGAGGAAMGYHRAGFDILGVDIVDQPNYPFEFVRDDAVEHLAALIDLDMIDESGFAAIHASPPCQDHSRLAALTGEHGTGWMLGAVRELLTWTGVPWVIENVPGADMRADFRLCGCMFDLPGLRRERWFETSWHGFALRPPCHHDDETVTVAGHPGGSSRRDGTRGFADTATWRRAMGIDWMTARELAQAIPPAYTEHIGAQLIDHLGRAAA